MKKILFICLVTITATTIFVGATEAKTSGEQAQNQKVTTTSTQTCEETLAGQYSSGSTTCTNKTETTAEQSQSQNLVADQVVYRNGRWVKIHTPADTALDIYTTITIFAVACIGLGAAVALHKTI
ncbi:hypothetical protein KA078_01525 [Candidatus Woesebacteria bacterium]|nr:hypothetical protein [Candidatus Woesebacteria bacterium]